MVEASVQASKRQPDMMRRMFAEISDPERVRPLGEALRFLAGIKEVGGKPFDWNELYVATTTPGQALRRPFGRLAGGELFDAAGRPPACRLDCRPSRSTQRGAPVSFVATGLRGQAPTPVAAKTEPPPRAMSIRCGHAGIGRGELRLTGASADVAAIPLLYPSPDYAALIVRGSTSWRSPRQRSSAASVPRLAMSRATSANSRRRARSSRCPMTMAQPARASSTGASGRVKGHFL